MIKLFLFLITTTAFAAPSSDELLKSSDRARGAAASTTGISWTANIIMKENSSDSEANYKIKVRENNAIAEVISPARQKGEIILFNDRVLWFFKPGLKKPVSISTRQRLMGQLANGDIASTQYFRDYDGKFVGDASINGIPCWKLELKAKAKNVTYDKINYWISKDQKLGIKADFLTVSGELFKKAEFKYGNTIALNGENYPFVSEMKINDANNEKNETIISYKNPHLETHSVGIFNVNNLIR